MIKKKTVGRLWITPELKVIDLKKETQQKSSFAAVENRRKAPRPS